jgi:hypothetical protein
MMEAKKKSKKLVNHSTWTAQPCFPTFTPTPGFNYQPYPTTWQNPTQGSHEHPRRLQAMLLPKRNYPHTRQEQQQRKKTKAANGHLRSPLLE